MIPFPSRLGSCLNLEVFPNGGLPQHCSFLFGFNVFSLFQIVWDSLLVLVLQDLLEISILMSVFLVVGIELLELSLL